MDAQIAALVEVLREAGTVIVSSGPALNRAFYGSPTEEAARLNAMLRDKALELYPRIQTVTSDLPQAVKEHDARVAAEAVEAALSVERIATADHASQCHDPLCKSVPWADLTDGPARNQLDRELHMRHAAALRVALLAPSDAPQDGET
jgi:hypothetical protein